MLESGQTALGMFADITKGTYWLITADELFEIAANDESRDVWKIMLRSQKFDQASLFAKTPTQKDAVATASGDYLVGKKQYMEAATVYGRSSKPFEQVALTFIDANEQDALRKYLLTKLGTLKKTSIMQRMMVAAWLVELYMSKLNILDDTITTKAELAEGMNAAESKDQLSTIRKEFQEFVTKNKADLDVKTTYEVISSHGREEELLHFATVVNDYDYVLSYWFQRERWDESLTVLERIRPNAELLAGSVRDGRWNQDYLSAYGRKTLGVVQLAALDAQQAFPSGIVTPIFATVSLKG